MMLTSIALATLTLTQPELSSNSNNIVASRRQQQDVDIFALSDAVSTLTSEVSLLTRAVNDGTVNDAIGRIATQTMEATVAIREQNAVLSAAVSTLTAQMASVPSQIAEMSAAQVTATNTLTNELSTSLSTTEATLQGSVSQSVSSMTSSATAQQNEVTASLNVMSSQVAASMTAMNSTVVRSLASKMNTKKHIFVGGCTSHSYGGWKDICMNRVETDTARPKFYKETGARMKALVRGLFRISGQGINESCNWARIQLMVAGQNRYESLLHTQGWWWKDIHSNHVMEINAGQQFWIRQHAACGRLGYHAWSGTGGHQRNEFEYVGAARDQDV